MRVAGKVALVTGAARGMGRAHAVALAREGAEVVVCDACAPVEGNMVAPATPEDLDATVAEVRAARDGVRVISQVCDVRDPVAMGALVARALDELGSLDVVVANAGILNWGEFVDYPHETFRATLDTNLVGAFVTCQAALPAMLAGGRGGSIVLVSSSAGLKGQPFTPGYTASKHALVGLAHALANEFGHAGIRVNTIHPATVRTEMSNVPGLGRLIGQHAATMGPLFMNSLPTPFMPSEDQSHAVVYLASDESRYVTGLELKVDLGMTNR